MSLLVILLVAVPCTQGHLQFAHVSSRGVDSTWAPGAVERVLSASAGPDALVQESDMGEEVVRRSDPRARVREGSPRDPSQQPMFQESRRYKSEPEPEQVKSSLTHRDAGTANFAPDNFSVLRREVHLWRKAGALLAERERVAVNAIKEARGELAHEVDEGLESWIENTPKLLAITAQHLSNRLGNPWSQRTWFPDVLVLVWLDLPVFTNCLVLCSLFLYCLLLSFPVLSPRVFVWSRLPVWCVGLSCVDMRPPHFHPIPHLCTVLAFEADCVDVTV